MSVYVILSTENLTNEIVEKSKHLKPTDIRLSVDRSMALVEFESESDFPLDLYKSNPQTYTLSEVQAITQGEAWTDPNIPGL